MTSPEPTTGKAPAALAQIYEAYHGRIVAYAARLLGSAEAEDVAQEVFVKVGRSLGSLADPAKLGSWIYTIALNTIRDSLRKRSTGVDRFAHTDHVVSEVEEEESAIACVPDAVSRSPEETAIRNEMVACYLEYVRRLPATYYEVYVLREFEHFSNDEIARRLGLSLATVKIRLHRARARLYEELRRNCRCYCNERGELMGEPRSAEQEPD